MSGVFLALFTLGVKGLVHPKNENQPMIYSP